jgi:opacity protein-like surface antigen
MFDRKTDTARRVLPLAVSMCALTLALPALAQDGEARSKRPSVSRAKPVAPNSTASLVNLLIKQGVITEEQGTALIKQADDESYVQREAAKGASARAEEAAKAATAAVAAASPPGTKHVTYVPEIVKRQLRDEIKREVMAKAEKENWASPGKYPEWAQRIRFNGDMRARYEGQYFPTGNDPRLVNFNSINTGNPYDLSDANPYFAPTYNTSQNRDRARFRLRVGADIDVSDNVLAGFRFASGDSNSPVTLNQTMGGSGGNFSKYALWIDRAYMRYQPSEEFSLSVGRFDNPFWSPTDLVWYRDLGFDGLAAQLKHEVSPGITPFLVAGAFPTYNTDLNLGYNIDQSLDPNGLPGKYKSNDKWMYGVQAGVGVKFDPQSSFRLGVAYYDFTNTQGRGSTPCFVFGNADACDTDATRPSFAQKGNTYRTLRNIMADPSLPAGTIQPAYQYFGLASQFRPVVVSGQVDLGDFHPVHVVIDGEYVNNTAFNRDALVSASRDNRYAAGTISNNTAPTADGTTGPFNGGNQGWMTRVTVGHKQVRKLWDWNVNVGYKYLESDAMIDAFVDPDFGLGGTNLKGYFIGGNVGISDNVWATLRYMSANNISGGPYSVDVVQFDINAKF